VSKVRFILKSFKAYFKDKSVLRFNFFSLFY